MFFSDWGSVPRIERCGLDGRDRQIIVVTDIAWPNGLVIGIQYTLVFLQAPLAATL